MFIRRAALRPVPAHAVVAQTAIDAVEARIDDGDENLQQALDQGFRDFEQRQGPLSDWLSSELSAGPDELAQSLGYFLAVMIYSFFREAFPARLGGTSDEDIALADALLAADEELRANDPSEVLDSDDVLALGQPAVLSFIKFHVSEALDQGGQEVDLESIDRVYRALLVEVIALSAAVEAPRGTDTVLH